jgi:hypothetical protein
MKLIKRCWGCGKWVLPWQNIVHTKLVGDIHKGCAFAAMQNYNNNIMYNELRAHTEESALKRLNGEETKEDRIGEAIIEKKG